MKTFIQISFIVLVGLAMISFTGSANKPINVEVCLSDEEMKLFDLINEYRSEKGLDEIALSSSLSFVAQTHSKDLNDNYKRSDRCNMHTWSKEGDWSNCCYSTDHKRASCMWNKPRELTSYQGDGFEIAFAKYKSDNSNPGLTAQEALEGWKKSAGHNMVMVNKGSFKKIKWKAMGVGIYRGYATVWFGAEEDLISVPELCE